MSIDACSSCRCLHVLSVIFGLYSCAAALQVERAACDMPFSADCFVMFRTIELNKEDLRPTNDRAKTNLTKLHSITRRSHQQ